MHFQLRTTGKIFSVIAEITPSNHWWLVTRSCSPPRWPTKGRMLHFNLTSHLHAATTVYRSTTVDTWSVTVRHFFVLTKLLKFHQTADINIVKILILVADLIDKCWWSSIIFKLIRHLEKSLVCRLKFKLRHFEELLDLVSWWMNHRLYNICCPDDEY